MSYSRRFLLAFATFFLLAGGAFAQGSTNSDDASQASPPQAQSQTQSNDQLSADDQSGANDEREAEGQIAPPPPADAPSRSQQPPMSETIPGPSSLSQGNENTPDPPARAARLQYFTGSVSVQPQGTGDWANAELNRPLTNSDNIWADKDSRAEISVGSGALRIGSESSLTLTRIDENTVQVELHQGALNLHVRELYKNEVYEVDTPNQAFTVSQPGDYRFDVDPNADTTQIIVWRGQGQAAGNGPAIILHENEKATFKENAISGQVHAAGEPDSFDDWARSRDGRMDNSQSAKYVSPDVPGYQDLDEYGTWKDTPDYGEVWVPGDVAVGWAPYRYGHWIWVAPWGWTWVDDAPWGFAPFHYGRWVYWGGYWGWAPGPVFVRPYYAPALVTWFGGPRWGVGFGFGGGFGWCPLGFGEPFVPWYHVSRGYFGQVNITNTHITNVQITNIYNNNYLHGRPVMPGRGFSNMRQPNGFTAVSRNTLVSGQQVGHNMMRLSPNQMNRVEPLRSFNARPESSAVLGASRARIAPPARSFARPTMTRASIAGRENSGFRGGASAATFSRPSSPMANHPTSPMVSERGSMISRSVPRPPNTSMSRGAEPQFGNREGRTFGNGESNARPMARPENNVPRPPNASRGYSAPESRGNFGGRPSYGSSDRSYGRQTYSRPEASYDRGSYSRGSYERPAPSYQRPAPSYSGRSMPSYGGGRSAPSYGGRSSGGAGGGGHYGGGGGGRASSGGGGGHSGGGGGGHSGGGGHGGHR